jgi:hypothetical protein
MRVRWPVRETGKVERAANGMRAAEFGMAKVGRALERAIGATAKAGYKGNHSYAFNPYHNPRKGSGGQ